MMEWPTPYETRHIDTEIGSVHVIINGPEDGPPVFLFHAGAIASWSWKYNVGSLNQIHRTYAVDAMGEAGKSKLYDIDDHTRDGKEIAELYIEIADSLGIEKAHIIGASYGGFIGTNLALYAPERVEKLVLIGPMGVTPYTGSTIIKILLVSFFPFDPVQRAFAEWMIDKDTPVAGEILEWMNIVFDGVRAREAGPVTFSQEQLSRLSMPVLLILGNRDNLVGDPAKVREYVKVIPDLQTEELDSSHGIWMEKPNQVNRLVLDFIKNSE
jgi:pimeloyl-ACP methyl ester carboxylesterase